MANPIENWLYKGATQPRSYYANMPLWKSMAAEIPFSKYYEGFNPRYTGAGKVGLPRYILEGLRSLLGGQHGNIAGGTTGMRALYERGARFLPWMARTAMSAPAAGLTTLFQSTPANAGEQKFMDAINEQQGVMAAGQQALGQTQPQIAAQQAAAAHTQRGNYQAPTMTYEEIKKEADKTGGTRHAGEMTKAAGRVRTQPVSGPHGGGGGQGGGGGGQSSRPRNSPSSQPSSYSNVRRYGRADGGMVSIMDLLNRRV